MPTGINTPLGYSLRNVAGYLPRAEIERHPLFYEDSLTSSPVIFGEYEPLLVASHFGKKRKTTKKKKTTTRLRRSVGGSKRVSTTRKSPEASATTKKIGTRARGIDGNTWIVKKASNGVKRWSKITN